MKRASTILLLLLTCGFDYRSPVTETEAKKNCQGYTIIEFGKGIDCRGDTILLRKNIGFQALVID